jgi:hypothetical protein
MKTSTHFLQWLTVMLFLAVNVMDTMAQGPYPTSAAPHSVCENSIEPYGVILTAGSTYAWSISDPAAGTITAGATSNLIEVNWTKPGDYILEVVETNQFNCTGAPVTINVTVNPLPVIADKTAAAICSGDGFTVSPVNGTDIVPAGTTYSWSAPVVAGITGLASGSGAADITGTLTNTTNAAINVVYTVTPTSGTCSGTSFTVTVTVNPMPTIADKTAAAICSGDGFTFSPANGTDIVPVGTTYSWSAPVVAGITGLASGSGAANITGTLTNTTNAAIDVVYIVTPTSGTCSGASFEVTVRVNPKATIADITPSAICSGDGFTVSPVNGTDIVPAGTTYSWSAPVVAGITGLASGSGATDITGTLTNTTNAPIDVVYIVTPTSGTCSGASFEVTVKVYPQVNTSPIYHN